MKITTIIRNLETLIRNNRSVLLTGAPGCGKTSAVIEACKNLNMPLHVLHPSCWEAPEAAGLPFYTKNEAGELKGIHIPFELQDLLMTAKVPTAFFYDDLGNASNSVQAPIAQQIEFREINGKKISEHARFVAATNRRSDKTGVSGIISALLDRFYQVYEMTFDINDWCNWLTENGYPEEIVAFANFAPQQINVFEPPTNELKKSATARSITKLAQLIKDGMTESGVSEACCGPVFAGYYEAFAKFKKSMPDINAIINGPEAAHVPDSAEMRYMVLTALAYKAQKNNIAKIVTYMNRMPTGMQSCFMALIVGNRKSNLAGEPAITAWIMANKELFIG